MRRLAAFRIPAIVGRRRGQPREACRQEHAASCCPGQRPRRSPAGGCPGGSFPKCGSTRRRDDFPNGSSIPETNWWCRRPTRSGHLKRIFFRVNSFLQLLKRICVYSFDDDSLLTFIEDFVEKFLLDGDWKIVNLRRPRKRDAVGNEVTAKWTLFLPASWGNQRVIQTFYIGRSVQELQQTCPCLIGLLLWTHLNVIETCFNISAAMSGEIWEGILLIVWASISESKRGNCSVVDIFKLSLYF